MKQGQAPAKKFKDGVDARKVDVMSKGDVFESVRVARRMIAWLNYFERLRGIEILNEGYGKIKSARSHDGYLREVYFVCRVPGRTNPISIICQVARLSVSGPWHEDVILFGINSGADKIPFLLEFPRGFYSNTGMDLADQVHEMHMIARNVVSNVIRFQDDEPLARHFLVEVDHRFAIRSIEETLARVVFSHSSGGLLGEYSDIEVEICLDRQGPFTLFTPGKVRIVHRSNRGTRSFSVVGDKVSLTDHSY